MNFGNFGILLHLLYEILIIFGMLDPDICEGSYVKSELFRVHNGGVLPYTPGIFELFYTVNYRGFGKMNLLCNI